MSEEPLAPFPTVGRAYVDARRVGPGATTPLGRMRLDAIVDWLQQIAYEDVLDARLDQESVWIVRRTQLRVARFPVFGERIELRTACSGTGPLVTERRTSVTGEQGAVVEAAALWVPLDPETLRPRRTAAMTAVYEPSAAGRRVRARLRHAPPPDDADEAAWEFTAADLDVAGHVNNAASWRAWEQELGGLPAAATLAIDVEHPSPAFVGPARLLRHGDARWLVDPVGQVTASAVLSLAGAA